MKEVLFDANYFDVIKIEDEGAMMVGIEPKHGCVVVMPYTLKDDGSFEKMGVNWECNPLREGNFWLTMITGGIEETDSTPFEAAKRELLEESGYNIEEDERWDYLGTLTISKLIKSELFCYCVNVTNLKREEKKGDGTENERKSEFKLISPADAVKSKDTYILSMMMKYFVFKYGSELESH